MTLRSLSKKFFKSLFKFIPSNKLRIKVLTWSGYLIGKDAYIPASLTISDLKTRKHNVIIGDRVSIGPKVCIITDSSPNNSKLLKLFPMVSNKVQIDDDVWVGASVTILPGVHVGKCSVIAAGSLVKDNIPEYSVAAGVPAKVIKSLNPDLI